MHAFAPIILSGFLYSALSMRGTDAKAKLSLSTQAACSLVGWLAVAAMSLASGSIAPLGVFTMSQLVWLSPLNINSLWTCPHLCARGETQPTVSFYTPQNALGELLDIYMGYENYHVGALDVIDHAISMLMLLLV